MCVCVPTGSPLWGDIPHCLHSARLSFGRSPSFPLTLEKGPGRTRRQKASQVRLFITVTNTRQKQLNGRWVCFSLWLWQLLSMVLDTMDGPVLRQCVVVAGANGSKGSPHDAREVERERGRGHGQETPKNLLSPARVNLLKFPELPQIAQVALPITRLFISKLEWTLS